MSGCCSHGSAEKRLAVMSCPECGQRGKSVGRATLEHLLRGSARDCLRPQGYCFCSTPSCEVMYFSDACSREFRKADLAVRVGIKETEDPIPICYCFDHTRASVWDDIEKTGRSPVIESIKQAVQEGRCECEIKNPSGRCCLGEVTKSVQEGLRKVNELQPTGD